MRLVFCVGRVLGELFWWFDCLFGLLHSFCYGFVRFLVLRLWLTWDAELGLLLDNTLLLMGLGCMLLWLLDLGGLFYWVFVCVSGRLDYMLFIVIIFTPI